MKKPPFWLTCTVAAANVLAVLDLPYGYYQLLRLIVTGYAAYVSFTYFRRGPGQWGWVFGTVALLYNPLFVITMSKDFHSVVNLVVAGLVMFEFYRLRDAKDQLQSGGSSLDKELRAPINQAGKGKLDQPSAGDWLRIAFPPVLALMIVIAAVAILSNREAGDELAQPEVLATGSAAPDLAGEDYGALDAPLAYGSSSVEMATAAAGLSDPESTVGEFTDKVDSAVREFVGILKSEGMTGAQIYSQKCQLAAQQSEDILETDFCVAFDMSAVATDRGVTSSIGMPQSEYFRNRASNLERDYSRFSQFTPNRTEIIWQEVNAVLETSMNTGGR